MCEIYGFCGNKEVLLNKYTDEFWKHAKWHKDGFGYFLADKDELYVNENQATHYLVPLSKKEFKSKLTLCHIRFKTHGSVKKENCHPFSKVDSHGVKWTLIHNGYVDNNSTLEALSTIQQGDTDSERILLYLVESVNSLYEHSWIIDDKDYEYYLYIQLETALQEITSLGKVNLIFTDNKTNNMYVYMNYPRTLHFLRKDDGVHISTQPLTDEDWEYVKPNTLHVFNNGELVSL